MWLSGECLPSMGLDPLATPNIVHTPEQTQSVFWSYWVQTWHIKISWGASV